MVKCYASNGTWGVGYTVKKKSTDEEQTSSGSSSNNAVLSVPGPSGQRLHPLITFVFVEPIYERPHFVVPELNRAIMKRCENPWSFRVKGEPFYSV